MKLFIDYFRRQVHQLIPYLEVVFENSSPADLAIYYNFRVGPFGGGNQFLKALLVEISSRGLHVEINRISRRTPVCLINSFNFDYKWLRKQLAKQRCRVVHRVDGPINFYRGIDDGLDKKIWEINKELADVTIFQSRYSLEAHLSLGLQFKSPRIIPNACDSRIFNNLGRIAFRRNRRIRLISTSWSANLLKGGETYKWLDQNLDCSKFEYTFVGRSPIVFERITLVPPLCSEDLAVLLRNHDIYITASKNDPCSNALIEALACGLPAIYLKSGGHAEIVGCGGIGFYSKEEIPDTIKQLLNKYEETQAKIVTPSIEEIADQYLSAMGVESHGP